MQLNEFKRLIRAGESSRVEFKSRDFHNDSLAKEIVALSNMKGGRIYIGVRNNGELEDVEQKVEEGIVNICRNHILPSIIPDIETLLIEDRRIFCIHIDRGRHKPPVSCSSPLPAPNTILSSFADTISSPLQAALYSAQSENKVPVPPPESGRSPPADQK